MSGSISSGKSNTTDTGGVVPFFNSTSIRAMERAFGRAPVRKMAEFLR